MTIWCPRSHIRTIAIGLHWRGGRLLAADVPDDTGRIKGVRPLGGGVEFGERAEDALRREFHEELGIDIRPLGVPLVIENIYTHHGATGHEIVFAWDVAFPEGTFAGQEVVIFHEDNGTAETARWHDLRDLDQPGGPALFPDGLKAAILGRGPCGGRLRF